MRGRRRRSASLTRSRPPRWRSLRRRRRLLRPRPSLCLRAPRLARGRDVSFHADAAAAAWGLRTDALDAEGSCVCDVRRGGTRRGAAAECVPRQPASRGGFSVPVLRRARCLPARARPCAAGAPHARGLSRRPSVAEVCLALRCKRGRRRSARRRRRRKALVLSARWSSVVVVAITGRRRGAALLLLRRRHLRGAAEAGSVCVCKL